MQNFIHILLGSLVLSVVHALIPNHWLPLVAIGRTEKWTRKETLGVTAIAAFAHTLSTIIIGIIVGLIGYKLSESYKLITTIAAPVVLISLGAVYLLLDFKENRLHQHHNHINVDEAIKKKTKRAIIISLSVGMFFSPCLEIEAYYFVASSLGWLGIFTVSSIYLFITVTGIVLLVYLASKGIEKLEWHFMEHHEKLVSGLILILLGILSLFITF